VFKAATKSATPGLPIYAIHALLLVAVLVVYGQVASHDFVNYDDPLYVIDNQRVHQGFSPDSIAWAFTTSEGANWFPLTWLSHMLDYQLFALESGGHHLVNLFLHALSTLLLFALLHRLTRDRWRSAFVAAIFALHPLHVESVAWVAERKDVLSGLFWFLTLLAYVRYVEKPGRARYLICLALFACGLLSKQMVVTLPFVALLFDFWPLRRPLSRALWIEKLPIFGLALTASVVAFAVQQHGGAVSTLAQIPLSMRIENALVSYAIYLGQLVWPANLAVFYPYPGSIPIWQPLAALVLLLGITAAVWKFRERRYLVVGWLWFLVTLLPVIGLVQIGLQAHADRYTYLPLIGIAIAIAWVTPSRSAIAPLGAAACLILAIVTFIHLHDWTDSVSLFRHAIAATSGNYVAYNNLGSALSIQHHTVEAMASFRSALQIKPGFAEAESNYGQVLLDQGKPAEAIPHLQAALDLQPNQATTHVNFASALLKLGRADDAIGQYREALRLQPGYPEAHCGLGLALNEKGQPQFALVELREALRLKPDYEDAHYNLGRVQGLLGHAEEAIAQFTEAIRLKPDDSAAHFNLGTSLASREQFPAAIAELTKAVALDPDYVNARFNLASALAASDRLDEAITQFQEVIRRQPDFTQARQSLDYCLHLKHATVN